jgi:archaellum biogenesis ATPase FlaH
MKQTNNTIMSETTTIEIKITCMLVLNVNSFCFTNESYKRLMDYSMFSAARMLFQNNFFYKIEPNSFVFVFGCDVKNVILFIQT